MSRDPGGGTRGASLEPRESETVRESERLRESLSESEMVRDRARLGTSRARCTPSLRRMHALTDVALRGSDPPGGAGEGEGGG